MNSFALTNNSINNINSCSCYRYGPNRESMSRLAGLCSSMLSFFFLQGGQLSTSRVAAFSLDLTVGQSTTGRYKEHIPTPQHDDFVSTAAAAAHSKIIEQNLEWHKEAIHKSENLFYGFDFRDEEFQSQPKLSWKSYHFPGPEQVHVVGADAMPPPPFGMEDLARISLDPILSPSECKNLIEEAESMGKYFGWHTGARYGTPKEKVGALMPLEELSTSYTFVNFELLPRLFAAICDTYPCFHDPSSLRLGGARIVRYDATAGQTELGFHRDGLLITANIALNDPVQFSGGGTILEAVSPTDPIRLSQGHVLMHPGDLRHSGFPITSGKRYVLVIFILDKNYIPHDRYCAERGERDMSLASHSTDPDEKERLRRSAIKHFSDAIQYGARIDNGRSDEGGHLDDSESYQRLLRKAARHLGGRIKPPPHLL